MTSQIDSQVERKWRPITNKSITLNIVLLVLMAIAIVSWFRIINGSAGEAVNPYYPWGIFISLFLFFEGIAAGTLFFASIRIIIGKSSDLSLAANKALLSVGLIAAVCTGIAIIPDLGSPTVIWRLLFVPHLSSPMMLDVWLLGINFIVGLILLWAAIKGKASVAGIMAWILAVVSILLPLGTSWLFVSLLGKAGWVTSMQVAVFPVEAMLAGVCVELLVKFKDNSENNIIKIPFLCLVILNLVLILGELGYNSYSGGVHSLPGYLLSHGQYAVIFWAQVIVCLVIPAYLVAKGKLTKFSGGLVLAGIAIGKYLLIVRGNSFPYLGWPGGVKLPELTNSIDGYQYLSFYLPSLSECFIVIGVLSLGILLLNWIVPRIIKDH